MSKDKTYILRKPIKAVLENENNDRHPTFWAAPGVGDYSQEEFEKAFVEFDEDAIRKQITEEAKELLNGRVLLTSPFEDGGFNPSKKEIEQMDTDDILKFVDRVFSLITGEQ